jgi:small-conductance mechanosensitive channel
MRTLLRSLLSLALIVWVGAEIFFPVVAATTFRVLAPNTHTAGQIVGSLLRTLHWVGMVAGMVALVVLALGPAWGFARSRVLLAAMSLLVVMLACTVYSQFVIIPAMEQDRIAAGGAIDQVAETHPARVHFNQLHRFSTKVEGAVLFAGLATVILLAWADASKAQ